MVCAVPKRAMGATWLARSAARLGAAGARRTPKTAELELLEKARAALEAAEQCTARATAGRLVAIVACMVLNRQPAGAKTGQEWGIAARQASHQSWPCCAALHDEWPTNQLSRCTAKGPAQPL